MSRPLDNYPGVDVPDLSDAEPVASGQVSGGPLPDFVGAMDDHDHGAAGGVPVKITTLEADGDLDVGGNALTEADRVDFAGDVNGGPASIPPRSIAFDDDLVYRDGSGVLRTPLTLGGDIDFGGIDLTGIDTLGFSGDAPGGAGDIPNYGLGFVGGALTVRDGSGSLITVQPSGAPEHLNIGFNQKDALIGIWTNNSPGVRTSSASASLIITPTLIVGSTFNWFRAKTVLAGSATTTISFREFTPSGGNTLLAGTSTNGSGQFNLSIVPFTILQNAQYAIIVQVSTLVGTLDVEWFALEV